MLKTPLDYWRALREHLTGSAIGAVATALLIVSLFTYSYRRSQPPRVETDDTAPIAIDPDVRIDTLSNGLQYYIRANEGPERRAEFRLVVDAGSVLEEDDQQGLAHAVEHMAFRGTRHFPGSRVVDYLQSIGMRNGDDVNASTGFDETVYRLTVPTDSADASAVDSAVAMLADWAHDVTFDTAAARREAGVVFEEWRQGTIARRRFSRALDTLLFSGSRYASRFPIGDTATLRRFDVAAMKRFYDRWYRPELMAVIAVGDFRPSDVERLIKQHFGRIPPSATRQPRPQVEIKIPDAPRAAILSDDEATSTHVALWFPRAAQRPNDVAAYRRGLVETLGMAILNDRLDAAAGASDAPLLNAGISLQAVARPTEAFVVTGSAMAQTIPDALRVLTEEVARLSRFGVTKAELERTKEKLLADRRRAEAYLDTSVDLADAMVWHFLSGQPIVGRAGDLALANALLPNIAATDISTFAKSLGLDKGAAIVITTRSAPTAGAGLSATAMIDAARQAAAEVTEMQRDTLTLPSLISEPASTGRIVSERYVRDADVFDWTLGNGMRVLLKPTRFSDNDVMLRVTSPGGAALADPASYPSAFLSDQVLEATGVGPLAGADLWRLVGNTTVNIGPTVTDYGVQLSGSAESGEMEMLFQLAHLYFVAPRADTAGFRRYQRRSLAVAANRASDPNAALEDSIARTVQGKDPMALTRSVDFVERVSLSRALAFWRARTANASNFTVVLVGDFSLEGVRPLIARYFASLPGGHREVSPVRATESPATPLERSFERGTLPKSRTQLRFEGTLELTPEREVTLRALRDLLQLTLEDQLRESSGGTYGVSVDLVLRPTSKASYSMSVDFEAAPERVDALAQDALATIGRVCTKGPTPDELAKIRAAALRDAESDAESNVYWANELEWRAALGWPLEGAQAHRTLLDQLSVSSLRQGCESYVAPTRYVRVTMRPRTGPAGEHITSER
ncbi:MAG: insulinase family protein [Gemmatimonadaceae bacterium]